MDQAEILGDLSPTMHKMINEIKRDQVQKISREYEPIRINDKKYVITIGIAELKPVRSCI